MLKKISWINGLFAAAVCVAIMGCSKHSDSSGTDENFAENFKALVMGGRDIDTLQTWSTAKNLPITVSADFGDTETYTVYILPAPISSTANVAYLGMVRIQSGSSRTITVACPADKSQLYAVCFDSEGHIVSEPFAANAASAAVTLSGSFGTTVLETPYPNCLYYAFEIPSGTLRDFDYNDVVIRVGALSDRGDGTFVSNIQVMCVGNTLKTNLLYQGEVFGEELHSAIGISANRSANNSTVSRVFTKIGELTFTDGNTHLDKLPFTIQTEDADGKKTVYTSGDAPLYIVINGNDERLWFWPSEGFNIGVAYPMFSIWASNVQTALDWYDSTNATPGKVVKWTSDDE